MRALATISAMMLLAAGLSSCDMPGSAPQQQTAAQLPPPPAAAPPACNCNQTAAATSDDHLARFTTRHHYRHRYYGEGYHGSYTSQSEKSVDAYGYVSASRVSESYSSESDEGYSGGENRYGAYDAHGQRYYQNGVVWVDGYGRGYFAGPPPTVAQTTRGKRLDPWHGYDVDCPDDGSPQ